MRAASDRSNRSPRASNGARLLKVSAILLCGVVLGGSPKATGSRSDVQQPAILPSLTFAELMDGLANRNLAAVRRRTVLDTRSKPQDGATGDVPGVRGSERPGSVDLSQTVPGAETRIGTHVSMAAGSLLERVAFAGPAFDADLLLTERDGAWQSVNLSQAQRFEGQEAYLLQHADFGIESLARAEANYRIVALGQSERRVLASIDMATVRSGVLATAGLDPAVRSDVPAETRTTLRVAVLPRRIGRPSWLLDVDTVTRQPLLEISLDAAGVPVHVVETVALEERAPGDFADTWIDWWAPQQTVAEFASPEDAAEALPSSVWAVPGATDVPTGYALERVHSVHRAMNPEVSLVLTYGDGVDELFVVSRLDGMIPLTELLPNEATGAAFATWEEDAILTFTDRDVEQFLFPASPRMLVTIVGRSGHAELASLASRLFVQLRKN